MTPITPEDFKRIINNKTFDEILNYNGFDAITSYDSICSILRLASNQVITHMIVNMDSMMNSEDFHIIHFASRDGLNHVVKVLLDAGVSPNTMPGTTWEPIHYAAHNSRLETIELLLKNGSSLERITAEGDTPLIRAVTNCDYETSKYLIDLGANVNACGIRNYRPITMSVSSGKPDALILTKLLVESGADLNVDGDIGFTPLHRAIQHKNIAIIEYLLTIGSDVLPKTSTYNSPLLEAIETDSYQIIKILIDHLSATKLLIPSLNKGVCPLSKTTQDKIISKHKTNLNGAFAFITNNDRSEIRPIHLAILMGNLKVVQLLLDSGANVNDEVTNCNNLGLAVCTGKVTMVKILIDYGANVNYINNRITPLCIAAQRNQHRIMQLLFINGAKTKGLGMVDAGACANDATSKDIITNFEIRYPNGFVMAPNQGMMETEITAQDQNVREIKTSRSCWGLFG